MAFNVKQFLYYSCSVCSVLSSVCIIRYMFRPEEEKYITRTMWRNVTVPMNHTDTTTRQPPDGAAYWPGNKLPPVRVYEQRNTRADLKVRRNTRGDLKVRQNTRADLKV